MERLSELPKVTEVGEIKDINARRRINDDNFEITFKDNEGTDLDNQKVEFKLKKHILEYEVPELANYETETVPISGSYKVEVIPPEMEQADSDGVLSSEKQDLNQTEPANVISLTDSTEEPEKSKEASRNEETAVLRDDKLLSASEQKEIYFSSKVCLYKLL